MEGEEFFQCCGMFEFPWHDFEALGVEEFWDFMPVDDRMKNGGGCSPYFFAAFEDESLPTLFFLPFEGGWIDGAF